MSLENRILAVGHQIATIARRLPTLGYVLEDPTAAFPGPEPDTDAAIERIDREIGALPLTLKLFWRRVGGVNFIGHHDEWTGCDYPDPLVVHPPSVAIFELDEFLGDQDERLRSNFPYLVPIAPDYYHKENVSGGMWYNLSVPAAADDPPLNDEPHGTTFVGYLELAVRWAGFPGLDRCADHNWPIHRILEST
jgi:hypothetical protein